MKTCKQVAITLALALFSLYAVVKIAKAQTIVPPLTFQAAIPHTSCVLVPSITQYCFASDGLFISISGGPFTQLGAPAPAGVTSVTVCNASGATCGSAQTGGVTLNIPTKVSVSAPVVTATAPTVTIQ